MSQAPNAVVSWAMYSQAFVIADDGGEFTRVERGMAHNRELLNKRAQPGHWPPSAKQDF